MPPKCVSSLVKEIPFIGLIQEPVLLWIYFTLHGFPYYTNPLRYKTVKYVYEILSRAYFRVCKIYIVYGFC